MRNSRNFLALALVPLIAACADLDLPLLPGQIVRAMVSGAEPYDLFANVTAAPDGPLKLAAEPAAVVADPV